MTDDGSHLRRQFKTAWLLTDLHLTGLFTAPDMVQSRPRSTDASEFYYAEDYHQQYLHKNPGGYCGIGGCGVSYG